MSIWVLVADRACARIFSPDLHSSELLEIEDFVHPESRLRRQDTITDGPGRFEEIAGGRHSGEPETDFKHETAEKFAHQIVVHLEKGLQEKRFDKLAIVAPPLFLGVLRKKLPSTVSKTVAVELDKDFTHFSPEQIKDRLPKTLWD